MTGWWLLAALCVAGCVTDGAAPGEPDDAGVRPAVDDADLEADVPWRTAPEPRVEPDCVPQRRSEPALVSPDMDYVAFADVLLDEEGRSAPKRFEIPPDAASVSVVVAGDPRLTYVIERFVDAGGQELVSPAPAGVDITDLDREQLMFPGPFLSPNRTYWARGVAATLVPNNPRVRLTPGPAEVRVAAVDHLGWPARDVVQLIVQIKRTPPKMARGRLDLHLYLSGSRGWNARTGPCDEDLRRMLRTVVALYREAGIDLGEITFNHVERTFQHIDLERDLPALYGQSTYESGVSVFLVHQIIGPHGMPLGGVAGGVPGPPGMPGTSRSGVVVATAHDLDPHEVGLVVAHEVGHYLGLFHPSEWDDTYHDQLPDTPEGGAAAGNVMYLSIGDYEQHFTPQQGAVMRHNPAVFRHHD